MTQSIKSDDQNNTICPNNEKESLVQRWNRHDLPICMGLSRPKKKKLVLDTISDSFAVGTFDA